MKDMLFYTVESLFLALELTNKAKQAVTTEAKARYIAIAGKAWSRHWRRVDKAREQGYTQLKRHDYGLEEIHYD